MNVTDVETNGVLQPRHRLVLSRDVHQEIHGGNPIGKFNTAVAVTVTRAVGTVWCAYLFAALAFVSLPEVLATRDPNAIVVWIAQTFLQLVLLSIILVGQRVISAAQDARAETDHEILETLHTINQQQLEILKRLDTH